MGKKVCWGVIIFTIAINVVMLQWTIEAYLGREYEQTLLYSGVGIVMAFVAFLAYGHLRKIEYSSEKKS
ncbi:hypothetical protein [Evansella tamaricis]|uniref:Uncharacterized protein n=1 Tax=Evansella tamaricis TaxID=2069301 RepID=A0ABS6JHV3_9BACI|nr:hypothetical protein [Evansella tamaricis]MBU9713249.1 hypothetical protein [Evansella tamaricis]